MNNAPQVFACESQSVSVLDKMYENSYSFIKEIVKMHIGKLLVL